MTTVFISYRRHTAPGEARAIFENLTGRLGQGSVFMDVDSISLGRDFRSELQKTLAVCDVMLVVIDKDWADDKDDKGRRRLDSPGDYVRMEIESALKRDIAVTPVLVKGAQMPEAEQLPAEIRDLVYRNAFELTVNRWGSDLHEMVRRLGLDAPGRGTAAAPEGQSPAITARQLRQPLVIAGVVIAACLIALTSWLVIWRPAPSPASVSINEAIKHRPPAAQPVFALNVSARAAGTNPSGKDLAAAVKAAEGDKDNPFLILSRGEHEFIQAYYNGPDKNWTLEYRAGAPQFTCDQSLATEQVIKTMQLYRDDNADWADACKWRALKLEPAR
jgi:hypothetical protein